jgi:predicted N-formylglutamate amidohydrolase
MTELPFETLAGARRDLLFLCDHAANAVPPAYGTLGLAPALFGTHIASDIGAATVTRALAAAFDAPAVLARWSRLLIDLNRGADDPTLVMKLSDGSIIPGNAGADAAEVARRIADYHAPYHAAIADALDAMASAPTIVPAIVPAIVSMHSFTPVWKGWQRPWDVGVLWDRDGRLARPLIAALTAAGFVVGDNEPYSGELENDCLYRHGTMRGLPHVLIEIRQDRIGDAGSARAFAARLEPILARALAAMGPVGLDFTRGRKDDG